MWLLFVLHKVIPPLFVSFVNSLPVIACTTLLLGVLLIHSEPNTRKHKRRGSRDRTKKDSVTESLGFRDEEGLEANSLVFSRRAACVEEVSDKKDSDSDEWHEMDREQDVDPSDFKSVDDNEERSDSSVDGSDDEGGDVGEKDGGEEKVVSWSEDDQRILVQIGNSELERNRRLERVIAIRKARRLMVVDNGGDKPIPLHAHLSSIDASRKNPIEHPYEYSTEPPGPGSTASTQCPFDLPHDPTISKENLSCSSDSSNSDNECESSSCEPKKPNATGTDQFNWFAQSLASVDEHESLSREVSVIEEADVIGHEMYIARKGFGPIVSRDVPAPAAAKKTLLRSSVVSMRT